MHSGRKSKFSIQLSRKRTVGKIYTPIFSFFWKLVVIIAIWELVLDLNKNTLISIEKCMHPFLRTLNKAWIICALERLYMILAITFNFYYGINSFVQLDFMNILLFSLLPHKMIFSPKLKVLLIYKTHFCNHALKTRFLFKGNTK